jgi:hypothetical protein
MRPSSALNINAWHAHEHARLSVAIAVVVLTELRLSHRCPCLVRLSASCVRIAPPQSDFFLACLALSWLTSEAMVVSDGRYVTRSREAS